MKKIFKLLAILLVVIVVLIVVPLSLLIMDYNKKIDQPASDSSEIVEFVIEEGQTTDEIAQNLEDAGLIVNKLYFRIYLKQKGFETKLQAGSFKLKRNLTIKKISEELQHASIPDIWVTIPESLMATEIADVLEQGFQANPETSFDKQQFLNMLNDPSHVSNLGIPIPAGKPLEGYLYPDTYRFPADANAEYVLNAILSDGFKDKIYEKYQPEIDQSQFSLYEVLILASILERETRHPEDRPMVADILIRRINNNWALEVDATLLYYFGDWKHEITYQDLQLDTPYNTRQNSGLTPTPICNPGEETIKAILYPEENQYWFYISDADGILHYATTLEEHNANINQYLQ
ncbi:endolytic transglycosylase MltG [Candidatus Dojkabacteria bacterium]|nr:endolytic transglycosylase MltG [Candidatus Dojkabacteria bacterium]